MNDKPKLTVNILTRASQDRLARLVGEISPFADEILIGVDAESTDRTYELACGLADLVYRFRLPGQLSPARMLVFDYATGDWILSLDDDESVEENFEAILPMLLTDASITHAWFTRRWIVNLDPCEYLHAPPWHPDFQLRLFRNDRSLVWKPDYVHSLYYVQGTGHVEERTSILHYELVTNTDAARAWKLDMYRRTSGPSSVENYAPPADALRRPAPRARAAASVLRPRKGIVHAQIRDLKPVGLPPWKVEFLDLDVPSTARPRELLIAEIRVKNSGELTWSRRNNTNREWPTLNLGCHLLDARGNMVDYDYHRVQIPRRVRPGEQLTFAFGFPAPSAIGRYLLEWDMVSEQDCWFAQCGSEVARVPLEIVPRIPPGLG
jgi:hypothetical protein